MKRMLLIVLCLVFSFGLVIGARGAKAASSEKVVKIGLVGSWTGPLGAMGQQSRQGALVAQKHINEDGKFIVAGQKYKVEFVEWDDRTDPKMAVAGVNKLMDQDGIKVFQGPMLSASTLAAQPITESKKAIIVTMSMADQVIRPGVRYTARVNPAASWGAQAMVRYVVGNMGVKTVAVINENTATALSHEKAGTPILESLGAKIVGREVYEVGTTDFFTPLTKLKTTNPDVLWLTGSTCEPLALIMKQTKEIGWPVQTFSFGGGAMGAFFDIAGKACEGHIDNMALNKVDPGPELVKVTGLDLSRRKKLAETMKIMYPKYDPMISVVCLNYDYTNLIVEAMKEAGSVEDTDRIMKALLNTKYRGVYQQYAFMPTGQSKNFGFISVIHADSSFDPIAYGLPIDEEYKNWKITVFSKAKTIKEIRAERGY